jgi:hypothetical protein
VDVQKHYERSSIVICLKTKSKPSALRASKSIASKLDDFWFKMRLAELDVPASHLLIKGKRKEAFTSYAPKLSEALSKYCSLKGQGRASRFLVRVRCKLWPLKANTLLTNMYRYNIK